MTVKPSIIVKPRDKRTELGKLRKTDTERKTLSIGYNCLADYIKLAKKYWMIVTGYPSSGKSEWLDAVMVNMALLHGWKVVFYSPENSPTEEHIAKLMEKYMGKPINKCTKDEYDEAFEFVDRHFTWLDPEDDNPDLDDLLSDARRISKDEGLDALVMDPWNAITHNKANIRSDEYLQVALGKVIHFSKRYDAFTAIVAHPRTPQKDKNGNYPDPDLYMISDGAMWRNKADYGVVVIRPNLSKNEIIVAVQKIKQKWMGQVGRIEMAYDPASGRFRGIKDLEFQLPTEVVAPFPYNVQSGPAQNDLDFEPAF